MWAEGKVRIIDIASDLGVSTATVSNVIHGKTKKISPQTVKRVQEALEQRGYIPNMAATLLAQNNSRIIGVMVNNHAKYEGRLLMDPFVAGAMNYLSDAIEENGWFMMVKKAGSIMEAAKFASMWNMDGMVLLGFCADDYQLLRDSIRIPFVVYDGFLENGSRICNTCIDNRDGGRQMGVHLRELGHKRVLYLADNREGVDLERYEGLCEGLGLPADYWEIPLESDRRQAFYETHISRLRTYSAVFAASDAYAVEVMGLVQRAGVRIPEDMSIAGFDDGEVCRQVFPALTSVRQDLQQRAATAIQLLKRMKEDPGFSRNVLLPVSLVIRDSTGRLCD